LLDLRPLGDHRLAVDAAGVVEVDVDREARHVEDKQVERRPALEHHARLQERVAADSLQQIQDSKDLLQGLGAKSGRGRLAVEIRFAEHQRTSGQDRARMRSGTTRFQRVTSFPRSRRASR